jgi:hypothetical protein
VPIRLLGGHKTWHNRDGAPTACSSGEIVCFKVAIFPYRDLSELNGGTIATGEPETLAP